MNLFSQKDKDNDNFNFQPPEVIGTTTNDTAFVTPESSPNLNNSNSASKSFIKSISSISPFHHNGHHSKQQEGRSVSPGMSAHSFLESPVMRTGSPDRPQLNTTNSTHSISSNSGDLSLKKSKLPQLNFSKSKKSSSAIVSNDDDWNVGFAPSTSNYPDLSALTIEDDGNNHVDGYVIVNNPEDKKMVPPPKEDIHFERDENYPVLKRGYEELVKDPYNMLTLPMYAKSKEDAMKYSKIVKVLTSPTFDMKQLKDIAWKGIPNNLRGLIWQILINYLSTNDSIRVSSLDRKRKEYSKSISRLHLAEKQERIWHQIHIDVPRTNPSIKLYSYPTTQRSLENILYLWAIRHPASGYVQGINDLVTPFFQVFMSQYLTDDIDIENFDPKVLPSDLLNVIEADTFWCLTKVLDTIQDNYIHEQPGIFRQIEELKMLIDRDEKGLALHFQNESIDFIQFAFRWMNCMLMREFKLNLIIRMWDTYLSEFPTGFSDFHIYVCCAFLRKFTEVLMEMDFQDVIMFLQDNSKTENWEEGDIEMLLSEAYLWEMLYGGTSAHYK